MDTAALGALDPLRIDSPGLGAWNFFYRYGWKAKDDRQKAGLKAVKQGLIDNGHGKGIDLSMFVFGDAARNRTREFQKAKNLTADGVIGPQTMGHLLKLYIDAAELDNHIPNHTLAKLCNGESNYDPIAEGVVDEEDEGVLQFHMPYWPNVVLAQAWDPKYEITMGGQKLGNLIKQTGSIKGAIAAWNIGATYAKAWVLDGYPASGGPTMGHDADGNLIDSYERATRYEKYVSALPY